MHNGPSEEAFREGVVRLASAIREVSRRNGFVGLGETSFQDEPEKVATACALLHSEVSEALEEARKGSLHPFIEELADVQIRLLDTVEGMGATDAFCAAVLSKHRFNVSRPYKHGGKRF